jgi:hypothetical protein
MNTTIQKPARESAANVSPIIREIDALTDELVISLRTSVDLALRIGLRLLHLHRETGENDAPGGFRAALDHLDSRVPRSTAYRWINAATAVIARDQNILGTDGTFDPAEIALPNPGSKEWTAIEKSLSAHAAGTSMRRLIIGSAATGDESRMDELITRTEAGDPHAEAMLEKVAKGELTLVQAIRAAAGAAATKNKERKDPVYLDLDGATGQPIGLFPRCLVTLSNTFAHWEDIDESARAEARKAWKALVSKLPDDLRR